MINRDVIICYTDGKIKITNDFYHFVYDFGCYELDLSEIKYHNIKDGNLIKTILTFNDQTFILGYRLKTFIEKHIKAN